MTHYEFKLRRSGQNQSFCRGEFQDWASYSCISGKHTNANCTHIYLMGGSKLNYGKLPHGDFQNRVCNMLPTRQTLGKYWWAILTREDVRYAIKIKSVFSPWHKVWNWILYTHGVILLHTLLVKYYYDYLDRQSSGRHRGWVTYLYVGGVFVMPLDSKLANFQQKITSDTSCGKSQKFHCSNFTTMKSFRLSTATIWPRV